MSALPALLRKAGLEVEITRTPLEEIPENAGAVVIPTSAAGFRDLGKGALDTVLNRDLSVVVIDDAFLPQTDQYVPVTATSTSFQVEPPAFSVGIGEDATCGVDLPLLAEAIDPDRIRLPLADFMRWNGEPGRARASGLELELVPVLLPASSTVAGPADTSTSSETALAFAASRIGLDGEYVGGCLFVFSNHHLFTNVSLTREAHLRFVAGFLASLLREGETLYLLESLKTGDAAPSVGRTFGEARLLPFIAQAFAVLIALFIMIGAAFGPLRDPISHAHKAFSEHVQAIGRHYAAAGIKGTTHAAQSLARLLVIRHRHEARGGEGGGWVAVARHLAERYEVDERDVRAALRLGIEGTSELGAPGPDDPAPSSEQMLKTLSALLTQERS
jgi:hypothetical protein